MAGPQKLSSPFIPLGTPALTDLIFSPTTSGVPKKYTIEALKNFILSGSSAPVAPFANITAMLANITIASGFFAYVGDSSDGTPAYNGWSLWAYFGGDRSLIASYVLIAYEELLSSDTRYIETTASSLTVTPVKGTNNNYEWTVSGNYTLTWDFTGVPDGAEGVIRIVKDNSATARYIAVPTNSQFQENGYTEESELGFTPVNVNNVTNSGGLCRITTSSAHGLTTGQRVLIASVLGTLEANGKHTVTVIDSTNFDIPVNFNNAYSGGGTVTRLAKYLAIEQAANSVSWLTFKNRDGIMDCQLTIYTDAF